MDFILEQIKEERQKQDSKWGQQNHPILDCKLLNQNPEKMCRFYQIPSEDRARSLVETHVECGDLTYMHILIEEISEAACCGSNTDKLRKELIQSAAVLVAMIESLDRNDR